MALDQTPPRPQYANAAASNQEQESLLPGPSGRTVEPHTFSVGDLPWWRRPLAITAAKNLGLILLWYFFGTFLSLWNKLLVGKEHGISGKGAFPAPFFMSSVQFGFQHLIARCLLSTGLVKRKGEDLTWDKYIRSVVPNGIATGLDIGFSNYSLVFITLSFYVMCKSTTPLFLLTFAIAWGIEKPSWSLAAVVSVISCGLLLLVAGETKFDLLGFILVMSAAALAGLRWTITQILLQGHKHEASTGGPVEVIFHLTPIMGLTLAIISLSFEKLWIVLPTSPYFESFGHSLFTLLILAMGGVIAFSMVWAEFMLIANTSALTFLVAGTFKEIVTVGAAVIFLHESFTFINAMGLVVLIAGVVLFNWLKYNKLRQGEIIPVVVEDSRHHQRPLGSSGGSGNFSSGSGVGEKRRPASASALYANHVENGVGMGGALGGATSSGTIVLQHTGERAGLLPRPHSSGGNLNQAQNGTPSHASSLNGSSIEMSMKTSHPSSPHTYASEAKSRRVFVLDDSEDGTAVAGGGGITASAGVTVSGVLPLSSPKSLPLRQSSI
jgi:solute carrier family 35 protein C2